MEVNHDRPLLCVHLRGVNIETETVLVSDGFVVRDVKLGAKGTILRGIEGVRPMSDFHWRLKKKIEMGLEIRMNSITTVMHNK